MLIATSILGWGGILLYIIVGLSYRKLAKHNEFAFLHILLAFIYVSWLPIPFVLFIMIENDVLFIGTIFGLIYLVMITVTLVLQAGHLIYMANIEEMDRASLHMDYIMEILSSPFESFANALKGVWVLFLGIALWQSGELIMANIMFIFSLFTVYYLLFVIKKSLVMDVNFLNKIKPNHFVTNAETLLLFIILVCYISVQV